MAKSTRFCDCPEAEAAAKWWADRLREEWPLMDAGKSADHDLINITSTQCALGAKKHCRVDADAFEAELAALIEGELRSGLDPEAARVHGEGLVVLYVDYGACGMLVDAIRASCDFEAVSILPIKTIMTVAYGRVTVKWGASAPERTIFGQ